MLSKLPQNREEIKIIDVGCVDAIVIDLITDEQAIDIFLDSLSMKSVHTYRSYKKECFRFLFWIRVNSNSNSNQLLPDVTVQDVNKYIQFTQNPRPFSKDFLDFHGVKQQPFRKPLSKVSLDLCITVLHRMFEGLREIRNEKGDPYCKFNPLKLSHQGIKSHTLEEVERSLTQDEWQFVLQAIEALPKKTSADLMHYHRARWIFNLLYRAFLRRDEASKLTMSCFEATQDGWTLTFVGKGNKRSKIIVTSTLLKELEVYRLSLGLPSYPSPIETDVPAICSIHKNERPISSQAIYLICKEIYSKAAEIAADVDHTIAAQRLKRASPHWMRHTGISHSMETGIDPRYVQAQARHSSLNITARYDHKEKKSWRDAFNNANI